MHQTRSIGMICSFFLMLLPVSICAQYPSFTSSNLPIIVIDTEGQIIPDAYKITAHMGIIDNGPGRRNYLTDPSNDYDGRIGIEIRGSSSTMFPKKQYAVETRDDQGANLNVSLIGLPPENDWILYAPYSDKSLIRNVLAYQLWENMGHYASRSRLCELVLDDEYWGVYVLMEKIKRDKNRVDIATLNPDETTGDDLTGGYIIKIDKWAGENIGGWESPFLPYPGARQRVYYQYHYPKPDEIVPAQMDYIEEVVTAFESKMASSDYNDPVTGYTAYIDVDSFIDYFLINELGKNVDGYRLSAFMYKDKDSKGGKLKMGPVWDFNLAFGNADYYDCWYYTGWGIDYLSNDSYFRSVDWFLPPFWWCKLLQDRAFVSRVNARWQELKEGVFHVDTLFAFIDSAVNVLDEARIRNFEKWPILETYVWPNAYFGGTYEDEVQYLKEWINNRILWIDANIGDIDEGLVAGPEQFTLQQNYPNPFNLATTLRFYLPHPTHVRLIIYDLQGREIIRLADGRIPAGPQRRVWQGHASDGRVVPSSLYIARLITLEYVKSIKMLLLR